MKTQFEVIPGSVCIGDKFIYRGRVYKAFSIEHDLTCLDWPGRVYDKVMATPDPDNPYILNEDQVYDHINNPRQF